MVQQPPTSGPAIGALVLGILGLVTGCCTFGIFSALAIVCGHVALRDIGRSGGQLRGEGMAKTGLLLGYLVVVPALLLSISMGSVALHDNVLN